MITPSFSPTATERVLPKLALDFTTANLDSRVTFTRTTDATHPATYTNSNGAIVEATNNQPRFDYENGVCKGLLIEESRTNSIVNSVFADAVAGSPGTKPTSWFDAQVSGSISAVETGNYTSGNALSFTCSAQRRAIYGLASLSANTTYVYTITCQVLSGTHQIWQIVTASLLPTGASVTTYLKDGVSVAGTATVSTGTYKLGLLVSVAATAGNVAFWAGLGCQFNATGSVKLQNPQVEQGAFATSYIPTTTTALTRNADVATMTGTNFSDWWNNTMGSANVSVIPKSISGTNPLFQMDDSTTDNIISLRGNVANPELYIKATTDQVQIDAGTIVANTAYKLVGAWNTDNCAAAQNGAAVVTDTSATIPTVTQARIGSDGTNYANAWLQKINYWPQRITNNETQAFSK